MGGQLGEGRAVGTGSGGVYGSLAAAWWRCHQSMVSVNQLLTAGLLIDLPGRGK